MKKLSFIILSFLFIAATSFGQEDPAKALKKASKALGSYNLSPEQNAAKLDEAVRLIDIASKDETVAKQVKTWQIKGDIYSEVVQKDISALVDNPDHTLVNPKAGLTAVDAYNKALKLAVKKYETKDAAQGLSRACKNLNYIGNAQIQAKDYAGAYKSMITVLNNNDLIIEKGAEAAIVPEEVENQKYVAAVCADASGNTEASTTLFEKLYTSGYKEPAVYAKYFNILSTAGKSDEALVVLEKGRELFPDDIEILFTEINYYIQKEEYVVLEEKLKQAIAQEPDNPSIYSALGNVYMNLYTEEFKANGDSEKGIGYFNSALEYFQKAIDLNPDAVDAVYSIGSLYFNKAVELVKIQNNLGMTKAEMKKFDEMKVEIDELFNKSLPYFTKAESLDPNDLNTLIALNEIYARLQDFEKAGEFKKRKELVQGGGQNEASYFKQ